MIPNMDGKKRFFVKFIKIASCAFFCAFISCAAKSANCSAGYYSYLYLQCYGCPKGCFCPGVSDAPWHGHVYDTVAGWCKDRSVGEWHESLGLRLCPQAYPESPDSSPDACNCYLKLPAGKYVPNEKGGMRDCPKGHYCPKKDGVIAYTNCASGKQVRENMDTKVDYKPYVVPCPVGTYNDITGLTKLADCKWCPSKSGNNWYYGGDTGKTSYSQCAEFLNAGASGLENCASGKIKKNATSTTAWGGAVNVDLKAKAGYYVNGVTCSKCDATAGKYSPGGNLQQCYSCPTLFNDFVYYDDGETWGDIDDCVSKKPARKIANCTQGGVILYAHLGAWVTDQLNDYNYGSLRAKKGYEVTVGDGDLGDIKCTACKPGTYQSSDAGSKCDPCDGATDENHTQCKTKCGDGEYVDTETKTCKKCPCADGATSCPITQDDFDKLYKFVSHGSTTTQQGINSCTVKLNKSVCGLNTVVEYTYSQSESKYVLQPSSKKIYGGPRSITKTNANFGEDWCEQCKGNAGEPDAEYPINDKCEKCGIGNYVVDGTCAPCPAGHKCDKYGATVSEPCPIDTYAMEGSSSCTPCPTGYATLSNENGICKAGPENGKYKECTSFDACKSFPAQLCYSGKCPIISGKDRPQPLFLPWCNTLRSIRTGNTEIDNDTSLEQLRKDCGSSFSLGNGFKGGTYFMDNVSIYKGNNKGNN